VPDRADLQARKRRTACCTISSLPGDRIWAGETRSKTCQRPLVHHISRRPRPKTPAGHLGCLRVFPRTAAADARLSATRTCPVAHRRPRGLFVPLHSVPGEYERGRLSSSPHINGCTRNDNGAVGMGNNVHNDKEKMQRRRRALAGQGRPTRDRGCPQWHRAAVGRAPRTGNMLSFYRRTRILRPSMITLDGLAARGEMIIYE